MAEADVLIEKQGSVGLVILNRAEAMNALSNAVRDGIEAAFATHVADDHVRAIVLTGVAPHFSAGYDLEEVVATDGQSFAHRILEYHLSVYACPKPVVSAVRGFCLAGGFDLALGADVLLAAEKTIFGHPEIRFGAPPLITSLARHVGPARALQLILGEERISARRALELGFVSEVVAPEQLLPRALRLAEKLGRHDPRATKIAKEMRNAWAADIRQQLETEFQAFVPVARDPAFLESVKVYYASL
ncbi:MAG: enoyl-CoA hydratase/isomerase family protein [Leptospiraceae bacterium]|nr:enoyl-CoA hydratase/isomerase family protein [Leptospiraceae bacterium]